MRSKAIATLFEAVVARPVAVTMLFTAALVFGGVAYQRLAVELMPDIAYPTITVRTVFEGAAPQEVEAQVSRPIEEALATLDGLVTMDSRSRAGASDVVLGFYWGTDMAASSQTIRENLQTTWLPEGTERPLILRYDPTLEPVLRIALSMDVEKAKEQDPVHTLLELRHLAEEEVKRDLEAMQGVAAVRVIGGLEREIRASVREDWLMARGLRLEQVRQTFAAQNINLAGGSILEGETEYLVRTLNEYATVDELRTLRIRRDDGVMVPLTDVATIEETHKERDILTRLDGVEAVELEVYKEADANVVQVARYLHDHLFESDGERPAVAEALPDGMVIQVLDDQAQFIEDALTNLRSTALLGGVFAIGMLFLFLRDFRATGIIGIAIPVSVGIGFGPLYIWGVSLNLMSLGGLALGIGMLVDNAVVVLESIQRYREAGEDRRTSAINGVSDVASAVVASTLTTVAVFSPIVFVEGIGGQLFGDLSLAVVGALIASLAVALFLVPTVAALDGVDGGTRADEHSVLGALRDVFGGSPDRPRLSIREFLRRSWVGTFHGPRTQWQRSWASSTRKKWTAPFRLPYAVLRLLFHLFFAISLSFCLVFTGLFVRFVLWVGSYPLRGFAAIALWCSAKFQWIYLRFSNVYTVVLAGTLRRPVPVVVAAFALFGLSVQWMGVMGAELIPEVHQGRFTIETALPVGTPLEQNASLLERAEQRVRGHPEVVAAYSTIGTDHRADAKADEGPHTARLRVQMALGGDLREREEQVMDDLRTTLEEFPFEVNMSRPALFSFRAPLEVVVYGRELEGLRSVGEDLVQRLERSPLLRDVKTSQKHGFPEVRLSYDRERLSRYGLDTQTVATRVRDKIQGVSATEIHRGDDRLDLTVQLVESQRSSLADLRGINVNPAVMPLIPLDAVAHFEEAVGPSEIRRVDQERAVVVSANLSGFDLASASAEVAEAMASTDLPEGFLWTLGGQFREMKDSQQSLSFALWLAIFLVYVIMASTFENLVHPLVILFSVPLALIGVVLGLGSSGMPLSVVAFIGMIVLAGVVVNNAIVLVDTINRLRAEGRDRLAAIHQASSLRLRPILITTATTVLGLFPISLGFGAGAEVQQPLAITVIGGLLSSTLLTLVVIPAVYALATSRSDRTRPSPDGVEPLGTAA